MIRLYNNTGTDASASTDFDVLVSSWPDAGDVSTGGWSRLVPQTDVQWPRSSDNGYLLLIRRTAAPDKVSVYFVRKDWDLTIELSDGTPYLGSGRLHEISSLGVY
jgi:hypothetical protein